jgi:hypothetical protein
MNKAATKSDKSQREHSTESKFTFGVTYEKRGTYELFRIKVYNPRR